MGNSTGDMTVSDTINSSWSGTTAKTNDATNNQSLATLWKPGSLAGTPNVTATFASTDHRGIIISEFAAVEINTPQNCVSVSATKAAATTQLSGTTLITVPNPLIYGAIIEDSAGTVTITAPTLTIATGMRPAIVNGVNMCVGYKTGPNSGTTAVTFIFSASQAGIEQMLAFRLFEPPVGLLAGQAMNCSGY
jgi:hypothetical protein